MRALIGRYNSQLEMSPGDGGGRCCFHSCALSTAVALGKSLALLSQAMHPVVAPASYLEICENEGLLLDDTLTRV